MIHWLIRFVVRVFLGFVDILCGEVLLFRSDQRVDKREGFPIVIGVLVQFRHGLGDEHCGVVAEQTDDDHPDYGKHDAGVEEGHGQDERAHS